MKDQRMATLRAVNPFRGHYLLFFTAILAHRLKRIVSRLGLAAVLVLVTASFSNAHGECWLQDKETGKRFRIFNALKYEGTPEHSDLCLEPIYVMYAWNFFPRGPKHGDLSMPEASVLNTAIQRAKDKNLVTVIDIEHWPLKRTSDAKATLSAENYRSLLQQMKSALPDITVGYYGVVPVIDFSRAKSFKIDPRYRAWVDDNDRVKSVAKLADALFPSLYTITPSTDAWIARANAHLAEAKRLAPGKPVYPFIWPNYHEQGGKYPPATEVEADYWRLQLDFLRKNADGIVLWGGNKQTWKDNMRWWQETVDFIVSAFEIRQ